MQTRKYGKTGITTSLFGMGCMRLPTIKGEAGLEEIDKEKAIEMVQYAATHGVTYFDTAYGYHNQKSESLVGEALDGGLREKVTIATKQPFSVMKTKENMRRNLENTLKKLRTDYIDVYLFHNIQPQTWEDIKAFGAIEEFEKFRQEGLIRNIAFSYHGDAVTFKKVVDYYDWSMSQIQQNILDTDQQATSEGIRYAGKKGLAVVIMEPLRGGGLALPPKEVREIYENYKEKRTAVEWAFRHLYDFPEVSVILSGVSTLEQLKDNIRIFSEPDVQPGCLSDEDRKMLELVKKTYEARAGINCTGCEYCQPCPNGVEIPRIFSSYNMGMMYDNMEFGRSRYNFSKRNGTDASNCVECGLCESKCPQGLNIIELLKKVHAELN